MFKWLKNILGYGTVTNVINDVFPDPVIEEVQPEPVAKPKTQAKKPATKKVVAVDLDSMSKKDLLDHAKKIGVKANASLAKGEILSRIKDAK